jgi:hypothetical protein
MESRRAYASYLAKKRQKNYVLGPSLACPLYSKNAQIVVLRIPMVMYHKEIWEFWRNKKFKWGEELFRMTLPGRANQQAWLDRATELFYRMWDSVNRGKEWNEDIGT